MPCCISVSVYRRVFRSLVELEDICKGDPEQERRSNPGLHKAVENILVKSIVLGDISTLQKLHGKCIIYTVSIFYVLYQLCNVYYMSCLFILYYT